MNGLGVSSSGERAAQAAANARSIVLVLGSDYGTAVPYIAAPAATPPANHPAQKLDSRTASQGICT
jgi:hypothetical protein